MRNLTKIATQAFAVLSLIGAAACSGSDDGGAGPSSPAPSSEVTGTYSLTQVRTLGNLGGGGSGLPVTFTDGSGDELVFLNGSLTVGTDGRFDLEVHVTFRGNPATMTDYGTYSTSGGSVTFSSEKSTPRLSTASQSGNSMTANSRVRWHPVRDRSGEIDGAVASSSAPGVSLGADAASRRRPTHHISALQSAPRAFRADPLLS